MARRGESGPQNLLLKNLPEKERKRLERYLEPAEMRDGSVLIEPDQPIRQVLFPIDMVSSTLQQLSDGSTVEAGLMGMEGMIGIQLWLRERSTPSRTVTQVPGMALRMKAEDFIRQVMEVPESPLNTMVARYTHAFLVMTSQVAACNRLHQVEQRLCRWLMMLHNRVGRDEFPVRQEFLAQMLGVARPSVSIAAKILQKAGFIDYSRGKMRVLDKAGLRSGACECYELIESQVARIFKNEWVERSGVKER